MCSSVISSANGLSLVRKTIICTNTRLTKIGSLYYDFEWRLTEFFSDGYDFGKCRLESGGILSRSQGATVKDVLLH